MKQNGISDTLVPGDAADTTGTVDPEPWGSEKFSSVPPHCTLKSWDLQLIFALQKSLSSGFSVLSNSHPSLQDMTLCDSINSCMSGFCSFTLVSSYQTQDFTRTSFVSNAVENVGFTSPNKELVNIMNTHSSYVTRLPVLPYYDLHI